nr:Chain B, WxxVW motif peptide [synthetic construct]
SRWAEVWDDNSKVSR